MYTHGVERGGEMLSFVQKDGPVRCLGKWLRVKLD